MTLSKLRDCIKLMAAHTSDKEPEAVDMLYSMWEVCNRYELLAAIAKALGDGYVHSCPPPMPIIVAAAKIPKMENLLQEDLNNVQAQRPPEQSPPTNS